MIPPLPPAPPGDCAVRGCPLLYYMPLSTSFQSFSPAHPQVKLRCTKDHISMNTLKFHQGRLENLDDLTGYRNYTGNILPLPETTINAAVRDALYMPLSIPPGPGRTAPGIRTPPKHCDLGLNPSTGLTTALQCETSCTGEQGRRDRLSNHGLCAHRDWDSFLLPGKDRAVETRRLESSCRRHHKGPDPCQISHWDWTGEIPLATARTSTILPGVSVRHIDGLPDQMQGIEASTLTAEQCRSSIEPTTPIDHAQEYGHGESLSRMGRSEALPSFDCFLQNTFHGASPWPEQSPSQPRGNIEGPLKAGTISRRESGFPGPLKSRH